MSKAFEFSRQLLETVKPSMAYCGQALSKWRTEAREKLCELLGFDTFVKIAPELEIEYEGKIDGATEIRFSFRSEENYRVPCVMLLPGSTAVFEAGKQACEKAGVTDRCTLVIGNGGHRFFADDAWPVVHQYLG